MTPVPVIAIHGGAGTLNAASLDAATAARYHDALREVVRAAQALLIEGGSAVDAVCLAVALLEDCPLFNAGHGAVFTADETHELDAAVMRGSDLAAGAVAGVGRLRNPVRAARAVLDDGQHVLMAGAGAEAFAMAHGVESVDPSYFSTDHRRQQLHQARAAQRVVLDHDGAPLAEGTKLGTVGAVALDRSGHLAAATSTGGMTNKRAGRVGDSPLIGAGTYADDRGAAVSCTGNGEVFIRLAAAYDVSARMRYASETLRQATDAVVMHALPAFGGHGGLIALDRHGHLCMPFNTEGMYRGHARGDGAVHTAIHH